MRERWVAVSGTWRFLPTEVEQDVRKGVQKKYNEGKSLIVGAALGVDSIAIDEMLALDPSGKRLRVIVPTTLFAYAGRLSAWASGQDEENQQRVAKHLVLLDRIKELGVAQEGRHIDPENITEDDYLAMNDRIVAHADELLAFQVHKSTGTQDTIDKARRKGIPVELTAYET